MNAPSLLACLKAVGVRVALEDDSLSLDAPRGVLTPNLLDSIKTLKPELLLLLSAAPDEAPCGTLSAQSTADPEPPPREGAQFDWDDAECAWRLNGCFLPTWLTLRARRFLNERPRPCPMKSVRERNQWAIEEANTGAQWLALQDVSALDSSLVLEESKKGDVDVYSSR